WFSFNGERIGQGRENAKQFLVDHPEIYNSIEAKVLAHHNIRRIGVDVAPEVAAAVAPTADDKTGKTARASASPSGGSGASSGASGTAASSSGNASSNGKRPNA